MNIPLKFAQNFLQDPALIKHLVAKTTIGSEDTVYDIGAGKGAITKVLAPACHQVIAVELDPVLAIELRQSVKPLANVTVRAGDFLDMRLPSTPYKVFANIPFNRSADMLHKLVDGPHPPKAAYLIVQKEFANKLISGSGHYNSQLAIRLGVTFAVRIVAKIDRRAFLPRPRVDAALLEILLRPEPLVNDVQPFRDFIAYAYNAFKPTLSETLKPLFSSQEFEQLAKRLQFLPTATPTQLHLEQWIQVFNEALKNKSRLARLVAGHERTLAAKHYKRVKLNRTRGV